MSCNSRTNSGWRDDAILLDGWMYILLSIDTPKMNECNCQYACSSYRSLNS
jgi:hypothetical protein